MVYTNQHLKTLKRQTDLKSRNESNYECKKFEALRGLKYINPYFPRLFLTNKHSFRVHILNIEFNMFMPITKD